MTHIKKQPRLAAQHSGSITYSKQILCKSSSPSNSFFQSNSNPTQQFVIQSLPSLTSSFSCSSSQLSFIMKRLTMKTVAMTTVVLVAMAMAMALPAQATCSSDLSPYKVCMPAVLGDAPPLPTNDCCKVIKVADIACLCTTVTHASLPALNVEAALMLPKRCGVIAPGTSTCATGNPLGRKLMHL